jgi:carbon storage regulator CsrA
MLVLSRKRTEVLVIGEGIRITVLKVEGNHVRLGIVAPTDVSVLRAELVGRGPHRDGTTETDRPTPAPTVPE